MTVSLDLSLYPLTPDYETPIKDFIRRLRATEGLSVATNPLATQVTGEYDTVMRALTEAMRPTLAADVPCSFVIKILNVAIEPGATVTI